MTCGHGALAFRFHFIPSYQMSGDQDEAHILLLISVYSRPKTFNINYRSATD